MKGVALDISKLPSNFVADKETPLQFNKNHCKPCMAACGLSLRLGSPLPSDLWVISFLPYTKILARQDCLV